MDEEPLTFPDVPRLELERTIAELMDRAQQVLAAQGRLRSLLGATRAVSEDLDLDAMLRRIVRAAIELVGARYGALGVIDEDGLLERFIHEGIADEVVQEIGAPPTGHGLLGAVIEQGQTIRIPRIADDPRSVGFPAHHPPMDAFLGVPIRVRGRTFGNLYLTDPQKERFSDEDQEIIEALAVTAGVAIENARLYAETHRRERLGAALSGITAALLSPDSGDALGIVADAVATVVPAELVAIITPEEDDRLRIDVARGPGGPAIEGTHYPAEGALPARAIRENALIVERLPAPVDAVLRPFGHTVAVPLVVAGAPVGALCVSRGSATYSPAELLTISDFASQAGIAISLARAREQHQRLEIVEDRGRIARDLHDHVIQRLFATTLGLQGIAAADPSLAVALERHIDEVDGAIADIRTAIFALRHRPDSDDALRSRLLALVSGVSPRPRISFTGPIDLAVTGDLADDLVAVVRESLANITRHANATTALVTVVVSEAEVVAMIEDDGDGLPPTIDASGISNLAARAERLGGAFTVANREEGGVRVRWSAPLPRGGDARP
ncbi:Hypoxia sensor histidine kinase response regulator DosT [Microbacterium azadirachtae]|uniref:Hypoxia sensor histidine kinase response regulator DosT n=1 Tax=Microbacterium azadirachtae TaxID=582680 RepID=A0A0F0KKX9_9MICO|nr:GAF domain-containing protein [Microbacterium azadirachtae]KJL19916.1 Hypoxia sensor histidine kinase response regulator DosT [Microbacterium azadirachtae]